MNIETLRDFCLSLPEAEEGLPFGGDTLVFRVRGKMFCLTSIDQFEYINLKSDPEKAIELRELYEEVTPGYHMNKKHWNSIRTNGRIPDAQIKEWIKDSFRLVVASMSKKQREGLPAI